MERKRITCPETAHLEEIECERTPFGLVVHSCTRFEPACAVRCAGECARRMDRRGRAAIEDVQERVLIVFADAPFVRSIAEPLARTLEADGLVVELAEAHERTTPPPQDYDAIVVGAPVDRGRYARSIVGYVNEHRAALAAMPSFLYFTSRTGVANAVTLRRETGWSPTRAFGIARGSWFGDVEVPTSRIREIALAIADEIPACGMTDAPWAPS